MPTASSTATKLVELVRRRDEVDTFARSLLSSGRPVFGNVTLPLPDLDGAAELAFIRTASWLYVHYYESGRVGVRFLVRRNPEVAQHGSDHDHYALVHALRTWSQHNIDLTSPRDIGITETCTRWFEQTCGTRFPRSEAHWSALEDALLQEAEAFLGRLLDLIGAIEQDDARDVVCQQWDDRLDRDWPAHRFHEVIARTASDLGRDAIDPVAFYQRHGQTFQQGMQILSDGCDLEVEARKLIERTLLAESAFVLPITGHDVMEFFGIAPGPEVSRLLDLGRRLYQDKPAGREDLLGRMAELRTPH